MKLRKFKLSDAERVAELVGDRAVSQWTTNIPYPYGKTDAEEWIQRTENNNHRNPFAVELDHQIVACISYWPHDSNAIEVGYWVGKEYWGNGIATASLAMLLSSNNFPATSKIVAKVMEGNIGSEKVLLKSGFEFTAKCVISKYGREISGNFYTKSCNT